MSTLFSVIHPFTVHLPIAFFTLGFFGLYYWLVRGLTSGLFDNRIRDIGHLATQLGLVFLVVAALAGLHDALLGPQQLGRAPGLRLWFELKGTLVVVAFIIYATFLRLSGRRRKYLQEHGRLLVGCLVTQTVGYLCVVVIMVIGTMLAYHPDVLAGRGG